MNVIGSGVVVHVLGLLCSVAPPSSVNYLHIFVTSCIVTLQERHECYWQRRSGARARPF
jgi:hypothetical protein